MTNCHNLISLCLQKNVALLLQVVHQVTYCFCLVFSNKHVVWFLGPFQGFLEVLIGKKRFIATHNEVMTELRLSQNITVAAGQLNNAVELCKAEGSCRFT